MRAEAAFFQEVWQAFWAAVFPRKCLICGKLEGMAVEARSSEVGAWPEQMAVWFCGTCCRSIAPVVPSFCVRCGRPYASRQGPGHTCLECLTRQWYFEKARAFGLYQGSLLEAIHRFKYGGKLSLARPLSSLMRRTFETFWEKESVDMVVPVPLHRRRLRKRGFNQAYLLGSGVTGKNGIVLDGRALYRRRKTEPQTGLSREQRQKNIRRAFAVRWPERVQDRKILLVDDVFTTGATADACAQVLMEAGAARVDVLTLARTV
ncbi:MAG: ComF family protein [Deltaproteobacteria bacterium]|nr:ComF family protein [Deltaproteobacteria bacterium]